MSNRRHVNIDNSKPIQTLIDNGWIARSMFGLSSGGVVMNVTLLTKCGNVYFTALDRSYVSAMPPIPRSAS